MLEFVKKGKECKQYCFPQRVADCESSLMLFNYLTPMAICVEMIIKDASIKAKVYYDETECDKDTRTSLITLIDERKVRDELHEWGMNDFLINNVRDKIYNPNNDYKHHLVLDPRIPSPSEKLVIFKVFYSFLSYYYFHKTGNAAPRWNEKECAKLFEKREQDFTNRTDIYPARGKK